MRKLIEVASKLKYLGFLGLPMLFSDMAVWKYLWLFWLFGLFQVILTFPVFIQSIKQIVGLLYIAVKYNPAPDTDTYIPNVVYSLPFEGAWITVNGGVVKATSHSWDMVTQRYAYDFIILDETGKSFSKEGNSVSNYYCYGKKILAPADGIVIEVNDSCKDSKVIGNGKTDPLIKDIRGNFIIIQHSAGEYSFLAHLKPGSILVSVGQTVKRKQHIAMCGNSGNTSEPHLHFHLQNGKSVFTSVGLPLHFQNIQAELYTHYSLYDKRPVIMESGGNENFISRGQLVSNI